MNINWNIKYSPQPTCVVSRYVFANIQRMRRNIEGSGKVNVSVSRRTKTTLDIHFWYDKDSFAIAHIPAGAEKFKFVEASQYSFFDSSNSTRYYFRISKRQGLPELKEYISFVLGELNLSLDTLAVDMNIIGIKELK